MKHHLFGKLFLISSLALLPVFGCNQSRTAADLYEVVATPWKANTPNPLLQYIPEDAPFVLATQRSEISNLSKLFKDLEDTEDDLDVIPSEMPSVDDAIHWGNKSLDKVDVAIYAYEKYLIYYMTVENEQEFIAALNKTIEEVIQELKKRPDEDFKIEVSEWQGKRSWIVCRIGSKDTDKDSIEVKMAFHASRGVITMAMFDGKSDPPEQFLNMPKKPYSISNLDKDTFATLHINYGKLGELLFSIRFFASLIDRYYLEDFISRKDDLRRDMICDAEPEICLDQYEDDFYDDDVWYDDDDEELTYCVEGYDGPKSMQPKQEDEENAKHLLSTDEWIKKLETTSISDEVCIEEFKSIYKTAPALDIEFKQTAKGSYGFKFVHFIASDELKKELSNLVTDYAEVRHDSSDMIYGSISFKIYDAIRLFKDKKAEFINKKWKCAQIQGISDAFRDDLDQLEDMLDQRMFRRVFMDFQSISFVLKDYPKEGSPVFWASMRNAQSTNVYLAGELVEYPQMDVVSTMDTDDLKVNILMTGNDLIGATQEYNITDIAKYPRKRDYLADIFVRWDFVGKWVSDPKYVTNYYLRSKLNKDSIELTVGQQDY